MTTTDTMRETLRATEAQAAEKYAAFVTMRDGMLAEGINFLEDRDSFAKVEEAHKEYGTLADQAAEQRQSLASMDGWDRPSARPFRSPTPGREAGSPLTMGQRFVQSEGYQRLKAMGAFESVATFMAQAPTAFGIVELATRDALAEAIQLMRPGATTITGGGATSAGPFIQNELMPGFVAYARKRLMLASMVGAGRTDSDVVEYVRQTAVSTGAVETAEDTAAAESTIAFETLTTNVREITHYVPATNRAFADAAQLETIVNQDIGDGVLDRVDTEIISGGGTGQDWTGIYNASSIGTQALGADTRLDALHKAITAIAVAAGVLDDADYIGMHPNDWQKIRLEKDLSGQYLMGPAGMEGAKQAWGVQVVTSTAFTEGQPIAGAFERSSRLWIREGLQVTTGLNSDDFIKRRVSILGVIRAAFAVQRPGGFCVVTGF